MSLNNTLARRWVPAVVATTLGLSLLSGCGAGGAPRTGSVAADVEGQSISLDQVDTVTDAVCVTQKESGDPNQAAPRKSIQNIVLARLVLGGLLEEIGEDRKAELQFSEDDIPGWDKLSSDEQDALWDFYLVDSAGSQALTELGATLTDNPDEALNAGLQVLADKVVEEGVDVTFNPRFGLTFEDGMVTSGQGLSIPVSDLAKAAGEPDAEYLHSLPDSQVCGVRPDDHHHEPGHEHG